MELNGSLTTTGLKKPHPSRLVGGVQTWNGLVPCPCMVDKNLGRISQEWSPRPTPGPPVQEDESPSGFEKQWGLSR